MLPQPCKNSTGVAEGLLGPLPGAKEKVTLNHLRLFQCLPLCVFFLPFSGICTYSAVSPAAASPENMKRLLGKAKN